MSFGEMSARRNVLAAKFPSSEISGGEKSGGEKSGGEKSGGECPTAKFPGAQCPVTVLNYVDIPEKPAGKPLYSNSVVQLYHVFITLKNIIINLNYLQKSHYPPTQPHH